MSLAESTTIANEVAACGGAGGMDLRPDFAALSHEDQLSLVLAAWQSPLPVSSFSTTATAKRH